LTLTKSTQPWRAAIDVGEPLTNSAAPWTSEASRRTRSVTGAAWNMASLILTFALGLPLTVLLVRTMTPSNFGRYSAAVSISVVISTLIGLGLATAMTRTATDHGVEASQPPSSALAAGVQLSVVGASLGAATFGVLAVISLGSTSLRSLLVILLALLPGVLVAPLRNALTGWMQAVYRPVVAASSEALAAGLTLAVSGSVIAAGVREPAALGAVRSLAAVAALAVLLSGARWRGSRLFRGHAQERKELARLGGSVLLVTAAGIAISQLDIVLMGVLRGSTATGLYAPVSRLFDFVSLIFAAPAGYVLAALTAGRKRSNGGLSSDYHWFSTVAFTAMAPLLAALLISPTPVLTTLYGSHLSSMGSVGRLFAIGVILHVALGYNGLALIAVGDTRAVLSQGIVALGTSVAACAVLVPAYGAKGGAISTSLALVLSNIFCTIALRARHGIRPVDARMATAIAAFVVGLLIAWPITASAVPEGLARPFVAGGIVAASMTATLARRDMVGPMKKLLHNGRLTTDSLTCGDYEHTDN
jgi:O-antigen/teichoic acid export membrane protein